MTYNLCKALIAVFIVAITALLLICISEDVRIKHENANRAYGIPAHETTAYNNGIIITTQHGRYFQPTPSGERTHIFLR